MSLRPILGPALLPPWAMPQIQERMAAAERMGWRLDDLIAAERPETHLPA